jgi:serine/threonine protein kinase
MGEVYLAEDIRLERKVALKILPSVFAQEAERMRRFVQEAKSASALNHPNILTIYETGEFEQTKYIVSEYVEGETLSERLRREPLNLKVALGIAVQITGALQAAHGARIVHRDIKPDNVMIRPDGFVKLLDFGIAKLTEKQHDINFESEAATVLKANTTPGTIIGSAHYMSPEQARGTTVDARTDIFSFGLVLYEMLTGKRAFEGDNAIEVISHILQTEPVPVGRLNPGVPHEIERIVGKALRKDREERYQTTKDLLIDLKDAREELQFQKKRERSLSQLPKLNVKARSSVFRYKGANTDLQQIAKELNVQAILNGRIVQRGGDLSLYVELVDIAMDKVIWSRTYDRQMTNLASLQGEISRDVSNNLRAKLSGADEQRLVKNYTENSEAYQLYLKGQFEWNKFTQEDLQKGLEYYNRALEKDPNFALAYTGLSATYGRLGAEYLPPNEGFPKAKDYAVKALSIDAGLAEAHGAMAAVRLYYDWNWAEATKELERAQTLKPNDPNAHLLRSDLLIALGRVDEAHAEVKRARELDPLSRIFNTVDGADSYLGRQYDEAIAQLEKTISLDLAFHQTYLYLGLAYEQKRMYQRAIETFQQGMTQTERHPQLIASLAHAYAVSGERDKALSVLDELREISKHNYVSPYLFAVVYAGLNDRDQTLAWLDKGLEDRSLFLIWLKVDPLFDHLRDDPRFQALLRRVGLPS